jgi:hypothetical protein
MYSLAGSYFEVQEAPGRRVRHDTTIRPQECRYDLLHPADGYSGHPIDTRQNANPRPPLQLSLYHMARQSSLQNLFPGDNAVLGGGEVLEGSFG